MKRIRQLGAILLTTVAASLVAAAEPPAWLLGDWVLNSELTHELQPKQKAGGTSGFGGATVSVGGVGVPIPGTGAPPPIGAPRDPGVLRCDAMSVSTAEGNIHFVFRGSGEETMKPGNDQGRKTSWSRSKLTQKYATTTRSVTKTYQLDDERRLIVRVKLSPKGAKSATHVRVFERPPA